MGHVGMQSTNAILIQSVLMFHLSWLQGNNAMQAISLPVIQKDLIVTLTKTGVSMDILLTGSLIKLKAALARGRRGTLERLINAFTQPCPPH